MIKRDFDAAVARWSERCVARGSHKFNAANTCMDCGAPRRGPTVTVVRGGTPRRPKTK